MTITAETTEAMPFEPEYQSQADLVSAILAFNATGHRPFTANEICEWAGNPEAVRRLEVLVKRGWFELGDQEKRRGLRSYLLTESGAHRARLALADWEALNPDQAAAA